MIKALHIQAKVLLPVLFAVCAFQTLAEDVTFSTTGLFCAGSGPCTAGSPNLQIGVAPQETFLFELPVVTSVPLGTANVPLILFGIADIGTDSRPGTGSFTIEINQTAPSAGSQSFTGALSGNFAVGSDNATLSFSQNSVDVAGVLYTLNSPELTLPTIGPPTRIIPILVDITASPNPEPSFFVVTGIAFACLAFVTYRRRRSA